MYNMHPLLAREMPENIVLVYKAQEKAGKSAGGLAHHLFHNYVPWRQPEAAIVTCCHTVGKNGLGFYRPRHHYQIIQKVLYQQWFRWHRRWCIVGWTAWRSWHWLGQRRQWDVWWHTNGYNRCSLKRVMMMNFFGGVLINIADFSASYMRVWLQGAYWS